MLYHRNEGLKPIIKSLRDKIHFFYLPDEDHGRESSIFVPFFATQKATLPLTGRLAKLGRACVIPIYSSYNEKTSKVDVICHAPLQNFPTNNEVHDTQKISEALEKLINENRSQYMWTLKFLKTRPDENENIY
jgi:lauroyl-KDO2-lipid IV(A) myristoyltransferase